ncbi:EAL domain-containing protein [Nostoc flagelliforme FACHB-838]|uniref:EAL domain-containing protein n=1 Tax=Nostoc flagelliforme FACHB-838 TaxID=2692904 RepID=A0ABR8E2Y7_9NOSO|nr:EAL domain-containing protein [Nostoc flagelliforme]MBD2535773.1 EAL domain-containing protein [Nostoc flagelliforme FACHB-838]
MEKQQPFSLKQISSEDWENTPENVKCLVESNLASAALSESQSRLIQFLDATPIAIAVHDSTGQLIYINHIGRALLGADHLLELSPAQLSEVFQFYREGSQTLYPFEALPSTRSLAGEKVWVDDLEIHRGDRVVSLEVWATPIFGDQGQVTYAIVAFQDISDRKRRDLEQQIVENTLLKSERRYRQVIQVQTDLIMRSLPDTTITFANDSLCLALDRSLEDVIGWRWSSFVPPKDLDELYRKIAALTPENPIFESINQDYRSNNQIGWTQWINLGIFDEHGQLTEIQSTGRDITTLQEQIQREQALNRVFQSIRNSLELDTIFATATAETAQLLKNLDCSVVQYLPEQGIWKHIAEFHHNPDTPTVIGLEIPDVGNPFAAQLKQLQIVRVEDTTNLDDEINQEVAQLIPGAWLLIPLVIEDTLWGSFTITAPQQRFTWRDNQIEIAQSVADQLEIAIQQANLYQQLQLELVERRRVQNQLKHDALHDGLTGLPNRHLFMERLELTIQRANRLENYHFAVLFLDLDRFKVINDSMGHLAGDQLLIAIAQKLQATLRKIDLAARLGGDEFVILLEEIKDIQEVLRITERIFAELQTPLIIEGREVYTTSSVGIVLGTKDYVQASHLLRDADIAMYRAKNKGKARYEIFDTEMHTQALNRLHLENDLRRALKCQEFVLHYQPIVALDTGHLVGFEALIRWQHPTQGLKLPGEFIAIAEEIGLITSLDYWAIRTACYQLAAWQTAFPEHSSMRVSVNLSAQDLRQTDLLEKVDLILTQTHLNSCCLTLEITESMLIEDIESTISLLSQLKERGIQISIDDFGTGYSSLNYLHRLPVDTLKVDRSVNVHRSYPATVKNKYT